MPTVKIRKSNLEFFEYLKKLFISNGYKVDPLNSYTKYEIVLIKSPGKSSKSKEKIYGALIKAE